MDTAEVVVLIGGIALIGAIIWYFLLGDRQVEMKEGQAVVKDSSDEN